MLCVNSFLPAIGGRELVVHYLARSLQELGHYPRVVCPGGWKQYRKLNYGYPVYRYPVLRKLFPEQVRYVHLMLDIALHGCDVIHAHATYPSGYIASRLKRYKDIPLVITPHGRDIHTIHELGHGLRLKPDIDQKIHYAIQHTELLTSISSSIKSSLLDAGAPSEKIRDVPNGVDIERFEKKITKNVYEWLSVPSDSRLIITVGRYNPRKGHEYLIRAMPLILKGDPKVQLIIIGDKTQVLRSLIQELNIADKVTLAGSIPPPANTGAAKNAKGADNVIDWLAAIHQNGAVYVSAGMGEGAEGLSLAVLEAMAAGLPVVATNISGNRDIVKDGRNGFLVKPADHTSLAEGILKILGSKELRASMAREAKNVANKFSWNEIAKQYLNVYQEAMSIHKGE